VAKRKKKTRRPARRRSGGSSRGPRRSFASLLAALARAYGRRRQRGGSPLDLFMLAVLAAGRGERQAARHIGRFKERFVDWNEVRVARPRDLAAAAPDAPEDRRRKMQSLLQSLYEGLGGLDLAPLAAKKPSEARSWLAKLGILSREEVEAVLMIALGVPVLPASEDLARVLRRLGLVPRKATRARAHRAVLKGLPPESYRELYSLVGEHAGSLCHAQTPECSRCKLRSICKSKGKW